MKYQIGEFSKISTLSIKTLRYYHEIGLLSPESIDDITGYRYYDEQGYHKTKLIHLLKDFEFSNKEMLEIFDHYEDEADIRSYLLEKSELIQEKISHYKALQTRIENYKNYKEEKIMTQTVNTLTIEPTLMASLTYTGRYEDVGIYIGKLFKTVGMNVKGKPFSLYHDEDYKEENAKIEVCIPLKKEVQYKAFETKILPGGKALSILHIGAYDTLSESYKAITDYMKTHDLSSKSFMREHYLKGPGMLLKGNPHKYQTEIRILI